MSPELIGVLGIILLFVLLLCRMWVGAALGIVGFLGILVMRGSAQALMVAGSAPFQYINQYTLTVIPMFTLMGMIIATTDIGGNLFKAAYNWVGRLRGGLSTSTVVASTALSAIIGSHMVSTVIMSKIALPEMRRYNYDDKLATSSIVATAPLALILPPSFPLILYGIVTEQSIGKLFMSGIIPGILLFLAILVTINVLCRRNPKLAPPGERVDMSVRIKSLTSVIPVVVLFVIVLGGIFLGIMTTTESGAIGALGAILIALVTKKLTRKNFVHAVKDTVATVGMVLFLLVGTQIFVQFMAMSRLPFLLTDFIVGLDIHLGLVIVALVLMYLILGAFLPEIPMIVLTVPILFPALTAIGFDPIWFGLFVIIMMSMAAITPPIGMLVFLMAGLSKVPIPKVFAGVAPFLIGYFIIILLISLFPMLVTYIPSLM